MSSDRPYRLECWEIDPDTIEEEWRLWSTYITAPNALERRDKLNRKGRTARVVDSTTGEVLSAAPVSKPPKCPLCEELHDGPYDGSCLL